MWETHRNDFDTAVKKVGREAAEDFIYGEISSEVTDQLLDPYSPEEARSEYVDVAVETVIEEGMMPN